MYNYANEEARKLGEKLEAFRKKREKAKQYSEIDILRLQPKDIVVAYFNWHEIDVEAATEMHKSLVKVMPDNVTVLTMPDDSYLAAYGPEEGVTEILRYIDQNVDRKVYIEALRAELNRIDGDDLK